MIKEDDHIVELIKLLKCIGYGLLAAFAFYAVWAAILL